MGARVVANDAKGLADSYLTQEKYGASTSPARTEIEESSPLKPSALSLSKGRSSLPYAPALSGADHARPFLGVQTGCSPACTFYAPVLARGAARSAPRSDQSVAGRQRARNCQARGEPSP